jgi:hypothetical protein
MLAIRGSMATQIRVSRPSGALSRQLHAAASVSVSKANHATPSNAKRVGCSMFQPAGLGAGGESRSNAALVPQIEHGIARSLSN